MRAKFVNEFKRGDDPKKSMNIGAIALKKEKWKKSDQTFKDLIKLGITWDELMYIDPSWVNQLQKWITIDIYKHAKKYPDPSMPILKKLVDSGVVDITNVVKEIRKIGTQNFNKYFPEHAFTEDLLAERDPKVVSKDIAKAKKIIEEHPDIHLQLERPNGTLEIATNFKIWYTEPYGERKKIPLVYTIRKSGYVGKSKSKQQGLFKNIPTATYVELVNLIINGVQKDKKKHKIK